MSSSGAVWRTWLVSCVVIWSAAPIAQPPPAFEVASVRRNLSGRMPMGPIRYQAGRFVAEHVALRWLISSAYGGARDLPPDHMEGGPSWIDTDAFDIVATTGGDPPPTATRTMLRALLEDRFGLRVHRESRERPVHALVLATSDGRLGPQLRRSDGSDCTRDPAAVSATLPRCEGGIRADCTLDRARVTPTLPYCERDIRIGQVIYGYDAPIDEMADALQALLGETVVNRTGLEGNYSFELRYTPGGLTAPTAATGVGPVDPGTPISVALPEQLGLKLERATAAIEILVIDAVRQPSEN